MLSSYERKTIMNKNKATLKCGFIYEKSNEFMHFIWLPFEIYHAGNSLKNEFLNTRNKLLRELNVKFIINKNFIISEKMQKWLSSAWGEIELRNRRTRKLPIVWLGISGSLKSAWRPNLEISEDYRTLNNLVQLEIVGAVRMEEPKSNGGSFEALRIFGAYKQLDVRWVRQDGGGGESIRKLHLQYLSTNLQRILLQNEI